MATVEDVVTRVLGATDVSADRPIGYELVARWVSDRYQQLASRIRFRHRRQIGTISVPARIDTGLLTATRGSTTVTADADAQAVLSSAVVGRHLRIDVTWYAITAYAAPDLTIEAAFAGKPASSLTGTVTTAVGSAVVTGSGTLFTDELAVGDLVEIAGETKIVLTVDSATQFTATANYGIAHADEVVKLATFHDQTYDIVQRYYELAANVRWLGRFIHQRRHREVVNRAFSVLDMVIPERQQVSDGPWYWAEVGRSSNDRIRVELYPPSTDTELVNYVYWDRPAVLGLTDSIPDGVTEYALTEGALIDLFRYRASQEANRGNVELAAYWRNESRAQATTWERTILEVGKADRAVDDVSFLLQYLGQAVPGSSEIATARGEVWNRDVPLTRV